jgi:hypothetical protein
MQLGEGDVLTTLQRLIEEVKERKESDISDVIFALSLMALTSYHRYLHFKL